MNIWEKIKYEYGKGDSAIRQIIIINLGVFIFSVLVAVVGRLFVFDSTKLLTYFYLPSDLYSLLLQPWSIFTNIFFHSTKGIGHIFWNMVMLYFIGRILQDFLSRKQIWQLFIYGGLAGSILFVLSYNLFPAFADIREYSVLLGASGGVTAILVAAGVHIPRYQVRPYNLFNIEMRWIALILVMLDLVAFPNSSNSGGILAHVGGAIFGILYIFNLHGKIDLPTVKFVKKEPQAEKVKTANSTFFKNRSTTKDTRTARPNQEEIDAILDKISQSGYDSLSSQEKETLFKASE